MKRSTLERCRQGPAPEGLGCGYEETPLHGAAAGGHAGVIRLLLESGADVNRTNVQEWTALHKACLEDRVQAVSALLDGGADAQALDDLDLGAHG